MIEKVQENDYQKVLDILNQAIKEKKFTALLTPVTLEGRKEWFKQHENPLYPIFVYKNNNEVQGWMAISPYRDGREGFINTAEISYYIDEKHRGEGIGTKLIMHTIKYAYESGLNSLMAVIFADNTASKRLVSNFDFKIWGCFPKIVEIDGRRTDCLQYGLNLKEEN